MKRSSYTKVIGLQIHHLYSLSYLYLITVVDYYDYFVLAYAGHTISLRAIRNALCRRCFSRFLFFFGFDTVQGTISCLQQLFGTLSSQVIDVWIIATDAMEEFRAGVTACLRSWSALRTAVESGWGGGERESQVKADTLRTNIFDIMNGSQCPLPNFDVQDLAGAWLL